LKKGPTLHMMRGYTEVVRTHFSIDYNSDQSVQCIHVEGKWLNSYEAEEYIKQFGCSNSPVCHTLVGYASGYYSEICQKSVYFKEVSCKGMGDSHCSYVGKTLQEWGEDIKEELRYYQDQAIVKELEKTYKQLIEEQNIISRSFHIHKLLTDELANGSDLQDMASVVHNETKVPLLIEDVHFNPIAYSGIQEDRLIEIYEHEIVEKYDQTEIIET
ncbi:4-vinyl reductase, partial [Streptomyces rhizosphaericus]